MCLTIFNKSEVNRAESLQNFLFPQSLLPSFSSVSINLLFRALLPAGTQDVPEQNNSSELITLQGWPALYPRIRSVCLPIDLTLAAFCHLGINNSMFYLTIYLFSKIVAISLTFWNVYDKVFAVNCARKRVKLRPGLIRARSQPRFLTKTFWAIMWAFHLFPVLLLLK